MNKYLVFRFVSNVMTRYKYGITIGSAMFAIVLWLPFLDRDALFRADGGGA